MNEVRTYEEAVDIVVEWWAKKAFDTIINQNNGSSDAFWLLNITSWIAQEDVTDDKVSRFKEKLREVLMNERGEYTISGRELSVDYHPCSRLEAACSFAGINDRCLPVKSFTIINADNSIRSRFTYDGQIETI